MLEMVLIDSAFVLSVRWVLAIVFVVAVVHKLTAPASFVATMKAYHLLPAGLTAIVGYVLIGAELVTVFALLLNNRSGSAAAVVLLAAYTFAILINLLRGRSDIDCGCSGPHLRQTLSAWLVVRNLGLIALALLTLLPVGPSRALGVLDWFTSFAAAATFGLIYLAANHIGSVNARYGR
ncbi:MAG: methylamine utilization protein MauE [Gammaproteobacteria bacterium]|nr:methylamine utilization protein MauE [Gammaproteobacteria bacterium]MCP5093351.1 methylamine utilization protein MauE [Gammaproteobacteria bacterium]